jgi:hypothetical protein
MINELHNLGNSFKAKNPDFFKNQDCALFYLNFL